MHRSKSQQPPHADCQRTRFAGRRTANVTRNGATVTTTADTVGNNSVGLLPTIIREAVTDLRGKGISISWLGESEKTKIKVYLRTIDYDEFVATFDDYWLA